MLPSVIRGSLGLDFGHYIQGKSFTRSVSISEAAPSASTIDPVASGGVNPASIPIVARSASGGSGGSETSPSPFSSATATISPESPIPASSLSFPPSFPTQLDPVTIPADPVVSEIQTMYTGENARPPTVEILSDANNAAAHSSSQPRSPRTNIPGLNTLMQNPVSHRTISLLSHLLDSRLPAEWREALVTTRTTTARPISLDVVRPLSHEPVTVLSKRDAPVDRADTSAIRRPNPPTPSPSEESALIKRLRPNSHEVCAIFCSHFYSY